MKSLLGIGSCLIGLMGLAAIGFLAATAPGTTPASEKITSLGGLTVAVWSAPDASGRQPVVVFSHGFHGCATQSRYLMQAFAADGYLVFAPNHADATCNGGAAKWRDRPEVSFGNPQAWSDTTYASRRLDIARLIDAVSNDPVFGLRADLSHLALVGHSLGGYTVLGLAGAWPGWTTRGVKAVLALSPYDEPFLAHGTLGGLKAPVLYEGGTLDFGITPSVERPEGGYDDSPAPKYFVKFFAAGHLAWSDLGPRALRTGIVAYSLAFLDHYVKGQAASPLLTRPDRGVALLRYDSDLGSNDAGQKGSRDRPR